MTATILRGDCLVTLPTVAPKSVQTCVTSPPYYGLRDYGVDGQIGLEQTPEEYIAKMVQVFRLVRDALKDDGTLWLNLGDSYAANGARSNNNGEGASTMGWPGQRQETLNKAAKMQLPPVSHGLKPKDLLMIPARVALALQADGWYLRSEIIWHKPNPMPESVRDRPTKAHEMIYLLAKQPRYYYDAEAVREPNSETSKKWGETETRLHGNSQEAQGAKGLYRVGSVSNGRNRRDVWTVTTKPFSGRKLLTDYVGDDGKPYTASPDCPIHGHLARSRKSYTPSSGERPVEIQNRNPDTDDCLDLGFSSESKSMTDHTPEVEFPENARQQTLENTDANKTLESQSEHTSPAQTPSHSSHTLEVREPAGRKTDLVSQEYSLPASGHSKQKSKTGRARQTSKRDTASAQTLFDTSSNAQSEPSFDLVDRTHENNNGTGDSSAHPSAHITDRNAGMFSYTGLYCTCKEVTIDHFATFPPDLIEPCILAGSRKGDIVLDPFNGSGTTGAVALKHGREYIGCELNEEYIKLTEERFAKVQVQL